MEDGLGPSSVTPQLGTNRRSVRCGACLAAEHHSCNINPHVLSIINRWADPILLTASKTIEVCPNAVVQQTGGPKGAAEPTGLCFDFTPLLPTTVSQLNEEPHLVPQ